MDMLNALVTHLRDQLASGKLSPEETARVVDEIHQLQRRVVRPRDASKDHEPITVGVVR